MKHLRCFVGTLIIAAACAQDAGKTLVEASKLAKITLVDAIARANKALDGHADLQAKSIDDLLKGLDSIPENIRGAVRNNGGGHWNHTLFWTLMKKGGGGEPKGDLSAAINSASRSPASATR